MAGLKLGKGRLAAPRGALWLGILGLVITTVLGLVVVKASAWTQTTFAIDQWIHNQSFPLQYNIAMALDAIDKPTVVALILLAGLVIISFWRGVLPGIGFAVVAGVGWLLIAGVKIVVHEARPTAFYPALQEQANSFPSGHVTFVMALTIALGAALAGSRWRWPLVVLGLLLTLVTAWSRLFLGVHYPMDVVGGVLGGASGAVLVLGVWNLTVGRVRRRH